MHHRRSHSDPGDIKDDSSDVSSVSDESSSVYTVDLYTGWRLPDLNFSMRLPAWFVILVTLVLFRGPSTPPSCVA